MATNPGLLFPKRSPEWNVIFISLEDELKDTGSTSPQNFLIVLGSPSSNCT